MSTGAPSYDPDERHDTPLALELKARIRASGPIPIAEYFRLCLHDEAHGYYRRANAIGRSGDFVTAPEISQCFGEIIGLWVAVVWQQMGQPAPFHLVELGPGRGTMLGDMLRAMRIVPGLREAVRIELVETSSTLSTVQASVLGRARVTARSHRALPAALEHPAVIIGNEFLDTLPVQQWQFTGAGWRQRTVALDGRGQLCFGLGDIAGVPHRAGLAPPAPGDMLEASPGQVQLVHEAIATLASSRPVVALLIDYGHVAPGYGDTLQAVRAHRHVHPLAYPGESDLTAQVDFSRLCLDHATGRQIATDGPMPQGEFLGRLGIVERASRLMAANPGRPLEIEAGVKRLLDPAGMGGRFKAMAVRSIGLPPPQPFEASGGAAPAR